MLWFLIHLVAEDRTRVASHVFGTKECRYLYVSFVAAPRDAFQVGITCKKTAKFSVGGEATSDANASRFGLVPEPCEVGVVEVVELEEAAQLKIRDAELLHEIE